MDISQLKLIDNAAKAVLDNASFQTFHNLLLEVYLETELRANLNGYTDFSKPMEDWRAENIRKYTAQLQQIPIQ